MANIFNYNISGNYTNNIGIMTTKTNEFSNSVKGVTGVIDKLGKKAMGLALLPSTMLFPQGYSFLRPIPHSVLSNNYTVMHGSYTQKIGSTKSLSLFSQSG